MERDGLKRGRPSPVQPRVDLHINSSRRFLRNLCWRFQRNPDRHITWLLALMLVVRWPAWAGDQASALAPEPPRLGPGVNLGNALEAPRGASWGIDLQPRHLRMIREGGFQHVRLPVRWSDYAALAAPYAIESDFFRRVDGLLDEAERVGLKVILNIHHYEGMDQDPTNHVDRWVGLWRQLAKHYQGRPDSLVFELLNEPHGNLTEPLWNEVFPRALAAVRESHPQRWVVIGPGNWNNIGALGKLRLPDQDRHLLVTVHYYLPFPFTHQGAEWVKDSARWLGRKWTASEEELGALRKDLDEVAAWGRARQRPVYVGEFGSYQKADAESRVRWTTAVARECERRGLTWAYWEFGAGFGVYDLKAGQWRAPLLTALLP